MIWLRHEICLRHEKRARRWFKREPALNCGSDHEPGPLTKSHFERPASNTIAQNPLRGDARGTMRCALLMAKGSLFLGRLTELSDGVSVLLEAAS